MIYFNNVKIENMSRRLNGNGIKGLWQVSLKIELRRNLSVGSDCDMSTTRGNIKPSFICDFSDSPNLYLHTSISSIIFSGTCLRDIYLRWYIYMRLTVIFAPSSLMFLSFSELCFWDNANILEKDSLNTSRLIARKIQIA